MRTYIALLRGINLGGRNSLPMTELVGILEALGHRSVRTHIRSGNVVFESRTRIPADHALEIRRRILEEKGFEPGVLLLDPQELEDAIANNPFDPREGKALHLYFLESRPRRPDLVRLRALQAASEDFALHGRVLYLHAPDGIGRSRLAAGAERALGVPVTARNWNTVRKLAALARVG
jgi:uncharacterized protein (DUF1697 family)